jgi:anti-sigma regulatory factor (Ser/Thr protein kinase)
MSSSHVRGRLELRLAARAASLAWIRRLLTAFLTEHNLDEQRRRDALLIVHELAANAIEHGSRDEDRLEVTVTVEAESLLIRVLDQARSAARPVQVEQDEWRETGRGMLIVEQLANWSEQLKGGRREVTAQLPLLP